MGETKEVTQNPALGPFGAFALVSLTCCAAMVIIALVAGTMVGRWTTFSSDCIFALALMVASPALLGVGISFFVARTAAISVRGQDRLE